MGVTKQGNTDKIQGKILCTTCDRRAVVSLVPTVRFVALHDRELFPRSDLGHKC